MEKLIEKIDRSLGAAVIICIIVLIGKNILQMLF